MSSGELEQRIMERARAEGAALVGILRVADLKKAPSYATYDADPFYPEYEGVQWKDEYRSVLVWGLAHPSSQPVLDWWSLKVKGFTPGNRELAAQSKRLRVWMNEELGMGALSLPYQIEYGGVFLKDSAVLAGLGVIGRNNLVITPQLGPRVRWRGIFMEAQLEPTGPLAGFDPCGGCDRPCHAACPKDAFRSGRYERALCKQRQDQLDVDFEVLDGSIMGIDEPTNVTAYCRACELACPVAMDGETAAEPADDATAAAIAALGRAWAPVASSSGTQAPVEQTRFVLPADRWAAFTELLQGKSQPIAALAEAAAAPSPFAAARDPLRLEALAAGTDTAGFACGEPALDEYLATRWLVEERAGKTRVATRGARVLAYFGLKAASVGPAAEIERSAAEKGPRHVAAILLARLAVDAAEQGRGLGEAMLVQALTRCLQASDTMFSRAVLAQAPTPRARAFYERYGFTPSPTDPQHLLLRTKDIRKSLVSEEG